MTASSEPTSTAAASSQASCSIAAWTRYHLLMKPAVSGTPIRLSPPRTKENMVSGMRRPSPSNASMRTEPTRRATQPSARNSPPFIMAWLNRCTMPAVRPVVDAKPMPRIM
jgi:hypothetical protein